MVYEEQDPELQASLQHPVVGCGHLVSKMTLGQSRRPNCGTAGRRRLCACRWICFCSWGDFSAAGRPWRPFGRNDTGVWICSDSQRRFRWAALRFATCLSCGPAIRLRSGRLFGVPPVEMTPRVMLGWRRRYGRPKSAQSPICLSYYRRWISIGAKSIRALSIT